MIEFEWLEAKCIGNVEPIVFRLEDGALVKIQVTIRRAGKRIEKDKGPFYHVEPAIHIQIVPAEKKFRIPRSKLPPAFRKPDTKPIV